MVTVLGLAFTSSSVLAQDKAAIQIGGLHCRGCVDPVEKGLKKVNGVKGAVLDFQSGIARVTFDEKKTPVSGLVLAVSGIPHAMGADMKYSGTLVLPVRSAEPKGRIEQARSNVQSLPGVRRAEVKKGALYITFTPGGKAVTTKALLSAISKAGFTTAS